MMEPLEHLIGSGAWWVWSLVAAAYSGLCVAWIATPWSRTASFASCFGLQPTSCFATAALVERSLAAVSAVAFASFGVQVDGLIGSRGIAPAADLIRRRRAAVRWEAAPWRARLAAVHRLPNLFWVVGASDGALRSVCACGMVASTAICTVGGAWSHGELAFSPFAASFLWATAYVAHLSLIAVAGDFLGLQSDSNMCEVSALLCALSLYRGCGGYDEPSACAALQVLRWLALRKMLGCGLCKYYGSPMWRGGTAMEVHYWTQPLPNPLSRHAHWLPPAMHRLACAATLVVELVLPLLGALPLRAARRLAPSSTSSKLPSRRCPPSPRVRSASPA